MKDPTESVDYRISVKERDLNELTDRVFWLAHGAYDENGHFLNEIDRQARIRVAIEHWLLDHVDTSIPRH